MENTPITQEDSDRDVDLRYIKDACNVLMNKFDAVQIFVTRHDKKGHGTMNCHWGDGNWYARFGQISMWLEAEKRAAAFKKEDEEQ